MAIHQNNKFLKWVNSQAWCVLYAKSYATDTLNSSLRELLHLLAITFHSWSTNLIYLQTQSTPHQLPYHISFPYLLDLTSRLTFTGHTYCTYTVTYPYLFDLSVLLCVVLTTLALHMNLKCCSKENCDELSSCLWLSWILSCNTIMIKTKLKIALK